MDLRISRDTEYIQVVIKDLYYENEQITGFDFKECTFDHCTFLTCSFEGSSFVNCTFKNCNISAVKVKKTRFHNVHFIKSKVIGIDWTDKFNFKITGLRFEDSSIDYSIFNGLILKEFALIDSKAHEVDFIDTAMEAADCSGTDFERSNFLRTNLKRANFVGARNYIINPSTNKIKGLKLSLPEAMSVFDIIGIILSD
jgi:fluoroquinolone resistance protein